jgi:hypothetical protein
MNDDDLARAIAALRAEGERPAPQARMTRERILRDLRPRARSRRFLVGIPLAALLLGGSVLAATGRLPEIVRAATRVLGLERPDAPAGSGRGLARGAAAVPPVAPAPVAENPARGTAAAPAAENSASGATADPAAALTPPDIAGAPRVATSVDAGANRLATRRARLSAAPTNSPGSSPASESARASDETHAGAPVGSGSGAAAAPAPDGPDTLALYRRAHQIHFVEQSPARALAAWDAYLASDPHGPLAVDARYDRALCLVRLGRKDEARRALEPFAAGKYGAFRKNDASQLIDALNGHVP